MAYTLTSPRFSFIQFEELGTWESCNFTQVSQCLPVLLEDDIAFQFMISGTPEEIDAMCNEQDTPITVGLLKSCEDTAFYTEFAQKPQRYRISETVYMLFWPHGLPGMLSAMQVGECFRIGIEFDGLKYCSNCLQRISDSCHTSVVEYGNEENAFGFNYCASSDVEGDTGGACDPLFITFSNVATLDLPWTTSLRNRFGNAPTVQTWIYDTDGTLARMVIREELDAYPPNNIHFDFGGPASGVIKITG